MATCFFIALNPFPAFSQLKFCIYSGMGRVQSVVLDYGWFVVLILHTCLLYSILNILFLNNIYVYIMYFSTFFSMRESSKYSDYSITGVDGHCGERA